ncbi:hypothetical protein [Leptolyngbya sp. FACHB-671]|uniref:hypothetical protein n=1 Tax=Leptolyngbya sp. FACHB-671 TaxID=2692812 RepID=UPI001687977B|nr:hypothetical protein [Leptolyngbya sp. FACHB-671]
MNYIEDISFFYHAKPSITLAATPVIDNNNRLITDIAVVTPTDIYCLEFKWRSSLLADSEIIRQTVSRVKDFAIQLPELQNILGKLE